MHSFKSHDPLQKKWRIGTREIIYIIAGALVCIYMLVFFFKQIQSEKKYYQHINNEHKGGR
jgi:uncharacterized membrane protein YuzA (DUF378 family)